MKEVDRDYERSRELMERNRELTYKESLVEQVVPDVKKHVKTEKLIGKTVKELRDKPKKGSLV